MFTGYCRSKICRKGLLVDDQHNAVSKSLPWMYLLIVCQHIALWVNARDMDLPIAVFGAFVMLMVFSIYRGFYWWSKRSEFSGFSIERKKKDLRLVTVMAPLLALFFSIFSSFLLVQTGGTGKAFLGISIITLAIGGAFSLYVLPVAAISALIGAIFPLALTFVVAGGESLQWLGIFLFAVMTFSVFLLVQNFRGFADMVCSRVQLEMEKTTSQRATASVERLAYFDPLTDLPNRRMFVKTIADYQNQTSNGAPGFAVGVIDITGFKAIDDAYGRIAGDALLRQVADRLGAVSESFSGNNDRVARLGGDEFVFIVTEIENVAQAHEAGKMLCKSFKEDFELPETKVNLSFSCGFALFPYSDSDPDRLIARADLARQESARNGSGNVGVFSLGLESARMRETTVRQALKEAIANDEIKPWFQPIVRIENGEIAGFESLARWHDEKLGHVSPAEFIEIAEQSQLIEKLTLALFEKSLAVAKTWAPETCLYFNLSAKLLGRQMTVEKMLVILEKSGLPACRLDIELTETAIMDDIGLAKKQMQKFKKAGVGIALDDFGSGYSSLGQIRDLPLDKVKIDKSFTDHICSDVKIRNIVRAMIQLCKKIDIVCVVEGIEELEQLGLLSDMECELGQGYIYSKPIPAERTSRRVMLVNAA